MRPPNPTPARGLASFDEAESEFPSGDVALEVAEDEWERDCRMQAEVFDEIVQVTGAEAVATSLKMAEFEGLFTGISGGASMAAALKVANDAPEGSVVLTMLPDTAERYLSTPLFADTRHLAPRKTVMTSPISFCSDGGSRKQTNW